eukprot:SAG11_NODE_93_length_17080_cov_10.504093_13_plen_325_part_00
MCLIRRLNVLHTLANLYAAVLSKVTNDGNAKLAELEKHLKVLDKEQQEIQIALNTAYEDKLHSKVIKLTKMLQLIRADKRFYSEKLIPVKKKASYPLSKCTFDVIAFPVLYRDYKLCEARVGLTHKNDKAMGKKSGDVVSLQTGKIRWSEETASLLVDGVQDEAMQDPDQENTNEESELLALDGRIQGGGGSDVETDELLPGIAEEKDTDAQEDAAGKQGEGEVQRAETPVLGDGEDRKADKKLNPSSDYWRGVDGRWSGKKNRKITDTRDPDDNPPMTSKEFDARFGTKESKRAEIVKLIKSERVGLLTGKCFTSLHTMAYAC